MSGGSPKNYLLEQDLSFGVESLSSENIGVVLSAQWGPANFPLAVANEASLAASIGYPVIGTPVNGGNAKTWMVCAQILNAYTNSLYVSRAVSDTTATSNAFLGIVEGSASKSHAWRNGVNPVRFLNEDYAVTAMSNIVLKIMVASTTGLVKSLTTPIAQANTGAKGYIVGLTATEIYITTADADADFDVVNTITDGVTTVTPTAVYGSVSNIRVVAATIANLRIGDTVTASTSGATGVVVGLVEGGSTDYAYIRATNYATLANGQTLTTGRSTTCVATTVSYTDGLSSQADVLNVYALYAGTRGNDVQIAICDPSNYYKTGSLAHTVGGTETFADLFESGPNADYMPLPIIGSGTSKDIIGFHDFGTAGAAPSARPDGVANADGDRYINTVTGNSYVANQVYQKLGSNWLLQTTPVYATTSASYRPYMCLVTHTQKYYTWNGTSWATFAPQLAVAIIVDGLVKEKYIVATDSNETDEGQPIFIDNVLETNSNWLRSAAKSSTLYTWEVTAENFVGYLQATALSGGTATFSTEADFLTATQTGVDVFFNDDRFDVSIILDNHEFGTEANIVTFQNYIIAKFNATTSGKLKFASFCLPYNKLNTSAGSDSLAVVDAITYMEGLTPDSRWWCVDQWKKVYDKYNKTKYYIPCVCDQAGLVARTAIDGGTEKAPYGTTRGIVQNADTLLYKTTEGMRDLLYTSKVNSIFYLRNKGVVLWGQKTGYNKATSAISRINARRVLTQMEKDLMNALIDFNGENSNPELWSRLTTVCDTDYLAQKKIRGWLIDYKFKCDASNNPPAVQDAFELYIDVAVKLPRTAEYIYLRFTITKTSMSFDEVI